MVTESAPPPEPTVDMSPSVKIDARTDVPKPYKFPWPYEADSVNEVGMSAFLEFVPGKLRGKLFDEVYRILKPKGYCRVIVPYWHGAMGVQDFMYEWPPLCEQSFLFFNKGWRDANKLPYDLKCDFDFTYGYTPDPETASRSDETRSFNIKHYSNCVMALHITLIKRPPGCKETSLT